MGRKPKYSVEEKLNAVREYLDGNESMNSIAKHLNISFQSFKQWVSNYEAMGTDAFATSQNKHYSKIEKSKFLEIDITFSVYILTTQLVQKRGYFIPNIIFHKNFSCFFWYLYLLCPNLYSIISSIHH